MPRAVWLRPSASPRLLLPLSAHLWSQQVLQQTPTPQPEEQQQGRGVEAVYELLKDITTDPLPANILSVSVIMIVVNGNEPPLDRCGATFGSVPGNALWDGIHAKPLITEQIDPIAF